MRVLPLFIVAIVMMLVSALDFGFLRSTTIGSTLINLSLFVVIIIALSQGFVAGFVAASIAAGAAWLMSAVNGEVFVVAYIGTLAIAWVMVRRVVTTRSLPSLIATCAAATAGFYAVVLASNTLVHLFNRQALLLPLAEVVGVAIWQSALHPLLTVVLWRLLGRDRYERLQSHSLTM